MIGREVVERKNTSFKRAKASSHQRKQRLVATSRTRQKSPRPRMTGRKEVIEKTTQQNDWKKHQAGMVLSSVETQIFHQEESERKDVRKQNNGRENMKKTKEKKLNEKYTKNHKHFFEDNGRNDKIIRGSRTHGLMVIALVTTLISPIVSAMSSNTVHPYAVNTENDVNIHSTTTGYGFIGLVRDLNVQGNQITCYALLLFYVDFSGPIPIIIHPVIGKHVTIDNPYCCYQLSIPPTNLTLIFGCCENIVVNEYVR